MLKLNDKSKEELAAICESTNQKNADEFIGIFMKLKRYIPAQEIHEYEKLEELYNDNSLMLITAYEIGYYDGQSK